MKMKNLVLCYIASILPLGAYSQYPSWLLPPIYDEMCDFCEGVASVKQGDKWGYVKDNGLEIASCTYDVVYPFVDGVGVITSIDKELIALVDVNGKIVNEFKNKKGEKINLKIDPRYNHFCDGLLLVTDGQTQVLYGKRYEKWGYLDKSGVLAIDVKYFGALPFSEGKAGVAFGDLNYFYISTEDKAIIKSDFNNGKNAIGALGFSSNNTALIVDEKGLAYIDGLGSRSKDKPLKFTPLENYYDASSNRLRGVEGELIIDTRGRASAFISKANQSLTELIPSIAKDVHYAGGYYTLNKKRFDEDGHWQSGNLAIAKAASGKFGLVKISKTPVVSFSTVSERVESVFGSSSFIELSITNHSMKELMDVVITCDGKTETKTLPSKAAKTIVTVVRKATDSNEEHGSIEVIAEDNGLLLGSQSLAYTIIDKPSIQVFVPTKKFEITEADKAYPLKVIVKNLSDKLAKDVVVNVNGKTQTITLSPYSENALRYELPIKESRVNISVKPRNTPAVILYESIQLVEEPRPVEKEKIEVEKPIRGIGNIKR